LQIAKHQHSCNRIKQFGNYAVLCFILLQIVQVIIPILPGGISSVAGMLMFGNLQGLLYSYLGLIIGEANKLTNNQPKIAIQKALQIAKHQHSCNRRDSSR
jgi:hypothetical protein